MKILVHFEWSSTLFIMLTIMLIIDPRMGHRPGIFLGIISQNPSVSKSNQLHVDIFCFIIIYKLTYIPKIPLKWSIVFLKFGTSTIVPTIYPLEMRSGLVIGIRESFY